MAARKRTRPTTAPPGSDVAERKSGVVYTDDDGSLTQPPSGRSSRMPSHPASNAPATVPTISWGEGVPSTWLDRLLTLGWELPMQEGDESVVRGVVDVLAELLPQYGVGACFIGTGSRQQIIRRHPPEDEQRDKGVDPTRLFPAYAYETIVELPGDPTGSTLHAASDDPAMLGADAPALHLLRRAAQLLRRALDHAHTYQLARSTRGEINALNAQMVQAEKLASLGQIAAGMVHELNNPLTSIVAYTDFLTKRWMSKRDADPDEIERLRRIGESAHRLLRFTRDLVTYARPSGDVPIPVVIHGVIDQALVFCEHVVAEANARVERRFGDGVLPVHGLPEQLTQVFVNLVTNACHALPKEGGTITISTELVENDRRVRVVVADTGSGIPPQNLSRIFAPFFTTKTDGRGTGLGLAIVKSIVEAHDGSIGVDSEPGRGTRFVLLLPVPSGR